MDTPISNPDWHPLLSLEYATLEFRIMADEDILLSEYPGFTVHGGFGTAFKLMSCSQRELVRTISCSPCPSVAECPYGIIFESVIPKNTQQLLKTGGEAPHPFVISFPSTQSAKVQAGDEISFTVTIFGKAVEHYKNFTEAFIFLGSRLGLGKTRFNSAGKFTLLSVAQNEKLLFESRNGFVNEPVKETIRLTANDTGKGYLVFKSPVCVNGDVFGDGGDLNFPEFVKALYRRLRQMYLIWQVDENWDDEAGYQNLKSALRIADGVSSVKGLNVTRVKLDRWSNRKEQRAPISGITGDYYIEGNIGPLISLMRAGELTHVGKWTTFGFGNYRFLSI